MGQCSTLPAETKQAEMREQTDRLNDGGRKESLDFNTLLVEQPVRMQGKAQQSYRRPMDTVAEREQTRESDPTEPSAMDIDGRDDTKAQQALPPPAPPLNAVRTRCYKLNLDADIHISKHQSHLGPFSEPPPYLTYSSSEDESSNEDGGTAVAIRTAQIFRGITVSRDGTILSQNARATRSSRGSKTKVSEKSRQAAKIDKAKDLAEDDGSDSKMVSIVVVGEYDDMKHLVRDGSRKLREAEGLPDEALLSINRPRSSRSSRSNQVSSSVSVVPPSSSRRRRSTAASPSATKTALSPKSALSAPPKLKSNPRDTRRKDTGLRMRLDSCNDFMDRRGEDDWSHAWNIWNCGGAGTVSPLQPSSPNRNVMEGRNDVVFGSAREGGYSSRAS